MSAAPVSRSSALPEITFPSRRSPERNEPEQVFALPQEPVERARPRLDDDRNASRDSAEARDEPKSDDGARRTAAADAKSPGRADEVGKDRKAAGAAEPSDKAKTGPATDEAAAKDATPADGKTVETAAGDKPAKGKSTEERKAAAAPALDGAPVVAAEGKPEMPAVPVATPQPVPVPAVAAEFLALAALTVQGSEQAKPDGATTPEGKPEGQVTAASTIANTAAQTAVNGLALPAPTTPVKADGQPSAAGEVAAVGISAGSVPQLAAAPGKAKPEATSGEAQQGDAKAADGQAVPKEAGEAGKAMPAAAGGEIKATEAATAGQPAQASAKDEAAPVATAPQANAPVSPQAILAAGPQSLTTPQAPLTELDAAAQATAHAQAEAAHRTLSGETGRATPLHVVPVEIGARALAGNKRFDIRLDPAELGRIDVSLEISDKGEVSAKLTVDRVETLHMLQRDARTLERAFEQAGLKPSEGGIDMSLRDSNDQQAGARQQRQDDERPRGRRAWVQATDDSALVTEVASLPRNASRLGGVDLSI
ncbi:MAG TPA: flagellar hook-length control protein FliK [Bosea sp. (in: a-proteobacteria)]|jgi:flagellar hook-length control protein FliK|nr:flagellar hook-length control protein FliK [Bosea sp. (in: a-proteobacteria)]